MILEKLELRNYRNYRSQEVEFSPRKTLIVGRNAQGKSNLLESVYFLSYLRSRNASRMREVVLDGETSCSIKGFVSDSDERFSVKVALGPTGKEVELNGRKIEPSSRAEGVLKCILFSPEDLYIVRGEPYRRREYLDEMMVGIGADAASRVREYRHLLRQRNAVLKTWEEYGGGLEEAMEPWTVGLVGAGAEIVVERKRMVVSISGVIGRCYEEISGEDKSIDCIYECSFVTGGGDAGEVRSDMRMALESRIEEEKRARRTVVGPHRDELVVRLGGRTARYGTSQGEQRTLAYAMKVAEKKYIEERTGEVPLLLLDDVLSELDEGRRRNLLAYAAGQSQVMITATEVPRGFDDAEATILAVEGGRITVAGD